MFSPCGPACSSLFALSRHLPMWQFDGKEMSMMERPCYLRQLVGGRGEKVFTHFGVDSLSHLTSEIDFL